MQNPFRRRTVADIMSGFTSVVNELRSLEDTMRAEADKEDDAMMAAKARRDTAWAEANAALAQAQKIESLIG